MNHQRVTPATDYASPQEDDMNRLSDEAERYAERVADTDIHTLFNPGDLFMIHQRQRELLASLRREGFFPIKNKRILEVGSASGGVLREFLLFGATPDLLHGLEYVAWRTKKAKFAMPNLPLVNADGRYMPYTDACFDMVMQFTAISSILNDDVRRAIAAEMRRVVRPDGLIMWYDFWLNPTNPQTRGVRRDEIRALFPGCRYSFRRITLAPPIARRLAPYSWQVCLLLERLRIFNTHYLAVIRPK